MEKFSKLEQLVCGKKKNSQNGTTLEYERFVAWYMKLITEKIIECWKAELFAFSTFFLDFLNDLLNMKKIAFVLT